MKSKICIIISCSFVLLLSNQLMSCKSSSDETDPVLQMLTSGTWKAAFIEMDAQDKTALFLDFRLTFTPTSFTSENGLGIWPDQGAWSFADEPKSSINRSDGATVAITSITESELVLSFNWDPAFTGGRIKSVGGDYEFRLTK